MRCLYLRAVSEVVRLADGAIVFPVPDDMDTVNRETAQIDYKPGETPLISYYSAEGFVSRVACPRRMSEFEAGQQCLVRDRSALYLADVDPPGKTVDAAELLIGADRG